MIYALMTLYFPDVYIRERVMNIATQVDSLFIYDNSGHHNQKLVDVEKVYYYASGQNDGISKAFNYFLKNYELSFNEEDFIFFFDQDTKISANHISKMIISFKKLEREKIHVGCLGAAYKKNEKDERVEIHHIRGTGIEGCYKVNNVITSSMLSKYKVLKDIEFWNEDFFVDYADFDLCWRMKEAGYDIYIDSLNVIEHTVGSGNNKKAASWGSEKPERDYYQIREGLKLLHSRYTPLKSRFRLITLIFIRTLAYLMFWPDREQRLKFIKKGFKDYYN